MTSKTFDACFLKETDSVKPPYYEGNFWLVDGEVKKWDGPVTKVKSPIHVQGKDEAVVIGKAKEILNLKNMEFAQIAYPWCG